PDAARSIMLAITGLPVFSLKCFTSPYMRSLAVTPPPGELIRSTTARTAGSLAALSSFSLKTLTGFSPPVPSSDVGRALLIRPSTSIIAIFATGNDPSRATTCSAISRDAGTGVMRKDAGPQPARNVKPQRAQCRTLKRRHESSVTLYTPGVPALGVPRRRAMVVDRKRAGGDAGALRERR